MAVRQIFSVAPTDDRTTFCLRGELDLATVPILMEAVADAPATTRGLVLDLDGLTFLDAAGIRALLDLARVREGQLLWLRHPWGEVGRMLELVGLDRLANVRVDATTPVNPLSAA